MPAVLHHQWRAPKVLGVPFRPPDPPRIRPVSCPPLPTLLSVTHACSCPYPLAFKKNFQPQTHCISSKFPLCLLPRRPVGKLPAALVLNLAFAVQFAMKYLGPLGVPPLEITPSRIRIVTTWRVFSCAEAAKLIGYSPLVPLQVGFRVYDHPAPPPPPSFLSNWS